MKRGIPGRFLVSLCCLCLAAAGCFRSGFADDPDGEPGPGFSFAGAGGAFSGDQGIVVIWAEARGGDGSEVYSVFRSTVAGDYDFEAPVAELPAGSIMFLDEEPASLPELVHHYVVRASFEGYADDNLREVSACVPRAQGPNPDVFLFDGVGGAFAVQDGIVVVWNGARGGDGSEEYRVYRASESVDYDFGRPLAVLGAGSILYLDSDPVAEPGKTFSYVVRALYQGVEHGSTGREASARVPEPDEPSLRFMGASGAIYLRGEVNLFWTGAWGVDPAQVEYRVYRSMSSGGQDFGSPLASLPAGSVTYCDEALPDLSDGTEYFYVVRAFYDGHEDTNLGEVSAEVAAEGRDVFSCPAEMVNVDRMYCIDRDQHAGQPWQSAVQICHSEGKELCRLIQWYTACVTAGAELNDMTDSYEWVQDSYSADMSLKAGYGSCDYISYHDRSGAYDFRCCLE
ncbi:MAG: hypothetical protein JXR96_02180 [Deltaproteobacteria bacterium]|nr:hypothetical protein [Deltaproteobacteria bacterium]